MRSKRYCFRQLMPLIGVLCWATLSSMAQTSSKDFKRLLKLFEGTYITITTPSGTPSEQALMDQMTISVVPVNLPFLGEHIFYVKYTKGDGSLYRQRLYSFSFTPATQTITSHSMGFIKDSDWIDFYQKTELVNQLSMNHLKPSLGCADLWVKENKAFVARMDSCVFKSDRRGKDIFIYSRMRVSADGMATTEAGKDETGKTLFGKLDSYALQLRRIKK
ncbi:MAG: CpcT/CpeT family chromophore lyase [Runella sp.]